MQWLFIILTLIGLGFTCRAQPQPLKDSLELHQTDTLYFSFASHTLTPEAQTTIQQITTTRPGYLEMYIEGHTDAVGTPTSNDLLARNRSLAAKDALIAAGWPEDAVRLYHFGESRLAVNTPGREQRNRRVLLRSGTPKRYVKLQGTVRGADGKPLPGGAIAHGTYLRDTVRANQEGYFEMWLPLEDSITVDAFARDHFIDTKEFYFREGDPPPPLLDITLKEATPGKRLDIKNLYFVGNKTVLMPGGTDALDRLFHFMDYNGHIRIEIAGHVNHRGGPPKPRHLLPQLGRRPCQIRLQLPAAPRHRPA